jgi:hypothetical protein
MELLIPLWNKWLAPKAGITEKDIVSLTEFEWIDAEARALHELVSASCKEATSASQLAIAASGVIPSSPMPSMHRSPDRRRRRRRALALALPSRCGGAVSE